ncbi:MULTISPECIES: alpha/beta hydrolase [Undibacterium]|nr:MULTISPECIES: alpha/beta hydrolase-fold protein [Undibacterium]
MVLIRFFLPLCMVLCFLGEARAQLLVKPLVMGESIELASKNLGETRRINVYLPEVYTIDKSSSFPLMVMLDGGMAEDFLHISGLIQISIANGTMRPFILVGIENTVRRRDLTSPSDNALDKRDLPNAGGAAQFRQFLVNEMLPQIEQRYRTTPERVLIGESLAGLFTLETLVQSPDAFQTYIALDPSLWWNDEKLTADFAAKLKANPKLVKNLYFASSGQKGMEKVIQHFADVLEQAKPEGLKWTYEKYPSETHATIYHPAALRAFRTLFAPAPVKK